LKVADVDTCQARGKVADVDIWQVCEKVAGVDTWHVRGEVASMEAWQVRGKWQVWILGRSVVNKLLFLLHNVIWSEIQLTPE
jgi:hypothetical protein